MALKKLWRFPGVYSELDSLKKYLDMLDTYLEKAREKLESQPTPLGFVDARWRYSEVFPRIFRNSFFVTILSYLEDELVWMCESLRKEKAISKSWDEVKAKGSTLEKLKTYISKECGLEFPTGQSWRKINSREDISYRDIRNCIVHYAGNVRALGRKKEEKEKELRHYCSKQPGISIDRGGNLVLSKEFCRQAVCTLQVFFEELYDSYEGKKAP